MASLSYYCGGDWVDGKYEKEPRKPKIQVTQAEAHKCRFTLTDTDVSVANAIRRIILAEVPTMAIEIVNMEENDTVLFDEFIAHRMGLLPLSSHAVGDIPPDNAKEQGFIEYKDCACFDGCQFCTMEYTLDVTNKEDKVLNVTHFDIERSPKYKREELTEHNQVKCLPLPAGLPENRDVDQKDNGIIIVKLKKDQRIKMTCHARKGIPKYHSKFMPVATALYQYQPIINLDTKLADTLTVDEKFEMIESCPRKVFGFADEIEDGEVVKKNCLRVKKLNDCIFCDECVAKAKVLKKKDLVSVKMDSNCFHFTVESVTPDGPRSAVDVVRAALRVFDYKLSLFLKDAYDQSMPEPLWAKPRYGAKAFGAFG